MATPKKQTTKKKKSNTSSGKNTPVRISKLFRQNARKKQEKQRRQEDSRRYALEKREAELSPERYVSPEEAMGPTVYNERYLKKAGVYRTVRYSIIFLLVVFLLGMLNFFREEITIENFRYLMRNVNFELRTELGETGSISYTNNDHNVFAVYKSSLAQLSDRQIALYDAGGRTSYTGDLNYTSPGICASEKYVLAFDRQGGAYSLYTTFSQAHSASTGYPIADAALTDNGTFAIASRSQSYFGVVEVYNSSFQLMNKIQKNKYIASIDLTPDGKHLLIASYFVGVSGVETELMTLAVDSDEPTLLFTLSGVFPWEAAWMGDDKFVLICDEGVKFFNESGKIFSEYGFSGKNVIEYSVSRSPVGIALIERAGDDTAATSVTLLSEKGEITLSRSFDETVHSPALTKDGLILLSGSRAWRISEKGETETFQGDTALLKVSASGDTLYLCTPTRAVIPNWEKQSK